MPRGRTVLWGPVYASAAASRMLLRSLSMAVTSAGCAEDGMHAFSAMAQFWRLTDGWFLLVLPSTAPHMPLLLIAGATDPDAASSMTPVALVPTPEAGGQASANVWSVAGIGRFVLAVAWL